MFDLKKIMKKLDRFIASFSKNYFLEFAHSNNVAVYDFIDIRSSSNQINTITSLTITMTTHRSIGKYKYGILH